MNCSFQMPLGAQDLAQCDNRQTRHVNKNLPDDCQFEWRIHEQIGKSFGTLTEATGGADALAKLEDAPCPCLALDRHFRQQEFE
jgi:hypothetical protein